MPHARADVQAAMCALLLPMVITDRCHPAGTATSPGAPQ